MTNILDHMLQGQQFMPSSIEEFMALQLAKRLNDEGAILRYLHYISQYTPDHLIRLFHQAKQESHPSQAFHLSITNLQP